MNIAEIKYLCMRGEVTDLKMDNDSVYRGHVTVYYDWVKKS